MGYIKLHELNNEDFDFFEDIEAELAAADDIDIRLSINRQDEMADAIEKEFWKSNP